MGGNHKDGNSEAAGTDDSQNGFREHRKLSRNRPPRSLEEARPLRRSFDAPRRPSPISSDMAENGNPREQPSSPAGGPCATMMARLEMPKKAQLPFLIAIILCVILLVILICLIAFWPKIPYYMKTDICTDKECLDASQQMLTWANTSVNVCQDPYQWACGKFGNEYNQDFYGYNQGEWNFDAYLEYEEIRELDRFISQLPSASLLSYSAPSILKALYKTCRDIETLDKAQSEFFLKKAINSIDGWRALRDNKRLQMWDHKKALIHLQAIFGSFPFFKVSVENRASFPYGKIITIGESEVGLPHKIFYNLANNHKIINAYKMLLRDFAINMGIVGEDAKLFADEIFYYEQRIVSTILSTQEISDTEQNQVIALGELKKIAPSLPIFESVQAIFSKTKITEKTEVLVRSVDVLEAMSIVVSTTDKQPLNNFIVWSLARKFLPYMSREYQVSIQDFENILYGHTSTPPKWYFCSKTIRDWVPFAIDVLKQNPTLITQTNMPRNIDRPKFEPLAKNLEEDKNDELFKMMFYHIRNELQTSIENAEWIRQDGRHFLNEMLSKVKLQLGIPKSIVETNAYSNEFYEPLLLQNLFFVEHLEPFWSFAKTQMEKKLKSSNNAVDVIIYELYPGYGHKSQTMTFNSGLNMAIVSKKGLQKPFFSYKYPIAMNFARMGTDIAELLLSMTFSYSNQFNDKLKSANNTINNVNIMGGSIECFYQDVNDKAIPNEAITKLYRRMSSINLSSKSLQTFMTKVANSDPIFGTTESETISYSGLGLRDRKRQPGMRKFEDEQIFALSEMQRHCSITSEAYIAFKPYIEEDIAEKDSFDIMWKHLPFLPQSLSCSSETRKCSDIL